MDDDTDIWLEALSGRAADDGHGRDRGHGADGGRGAAREAQALRAAMLRQPRYEPSQRGVRNASREEALLERARRAGLIPLRARRAPMWWARLASWPAAGAYTAIACSALVAFILWHSPRGTEQVRGAPDHIVTLRAADPVALKRTLLRELRAAGIEANGYARLGVQGLDADLPSPLPKRVRAVLDRHHIATPTDGVLRIEIRPVSP